MARLTEAIHVKIKSSTASLSLLIFKIISGMVIGLTFALIGQEIVSYSNFLFVFVVVTVTGIFMAIVKNWTFLMMILFDLFAFVVGLLLKMYILMNG